MKNIYPLKLFKFELKILHSRVNDVITLLQLIKYVYISPYEIIAVVLPTGQEL